MAPTAARRPKNAARSSSSAASWPALSWRGRNVELLGYGGGVPGAWFWRKYQSPGELVLRVTAHDPRREAIECFARQFAPLITSGPAGLAGYAAGRPQVRPVFAYWPTLVPKSLVHAEGRSPTGEGVASVT